MSRFAKLFAANAIAAAGLGAAAVALSSPAVADPIVPPIVPGVPALSMIQDFATNPASMGAVLQTAATALNGASAMVGAPAPNTLPVSPIQGAPATPPVPAPAATPLGGIGSTVVPLLNQIGVPAQLVNLAPQMPFLGNAAAAPAVAPITPALAPITPALAPVTPVAPIAPVTPIAPAAAPAAPADLSSAVLNPLPLLTALP